MTISAQVGKKKTFLREQNYEKVAKNASLLLKISAFSALWDWNLRDVILHG